MEPSTDRQRTFSVARLVRTVRRVGHSLLRTDTNASTKRIRPGRSSSVRRCVDAHTAHRSRMAAGERGHANVRHRSAYPSIAGIVRSIRMMLGHKGATTTMARLSWAVAGYRILEKFRLVLT